MMHRIQGRKLGRTSPHRRAMMANMAASLIRHDRIETTLPKAKELRSLADRLVTLGKRKTLHARRRAIQLIHDKDAVHKLFSELAGRFEGRNGGYTRILKLGFRHGDAAPMAAIEYLPSDGKGGEASGDSQAKKPKVAKKKEHAEKKAAPKGEKVARQTKTPKKSAPSAMHSAKRASPAHKATRSQDK